LHCTSVCMASACMSDGRCRLCPAWWALVGRTELRDSCSLSSAAVLWLCGAHRWIVL